MADPDGPIRDRFSTMEDAELHRVLTSEADQWMPRALELAREERERRQVTAYRGPIGVIVPPSSPDARVSSRLSYVDIYSALMGAGAVGRPCAELFLGNPWWSILASGIVGFGLLLPVAWGLRARRRWAYWLNLGCLGLMLIFGALDSSGAYILWAIGHGIYFARRRALFPNR